MPNKTEYSARMFDTRLRYVKCNSTDVHAVVRSYADGLQISNLCWLSMHPWHPIIGCGIYIPCDITRLASKHEFLGPYGSWTSQIIMKICARKSATYDTEHTRIPKLLCRIVPRWTISYDLHIFITDIWVLLTSQWPGFTNTRARKFIFATVLVCFLNLRNTCPDTSFNSHVWLYRLQTQFVWTCVSIISTTLVLDN